MRAARGSHARERSGLWWCVGLGVLAGGAVAAALKFARMVVTPAARPESKVEVVALESSDDAPAGMRIWLAGPDTDLEGSYSFIFDAGVRETQHLALITLVVAGKYQRRPPLPFAPGTEVVGTIIEAAPDAEAPPIGSAPIRSPDVLIASMSTTRASSVQYGVR